MSFNTTITAPLSLSDAMGEDEHGEYVIRSNIQPTPFTLKEMTDANAAIEVIHWATIYSFVEVGQGGDGLSFS
jgi:hypothetical protein